MTANDTSHDSASRRRFPIDCRDQNEMVAMLRDEGMTFRDFECVTEGDYLPEDAAWNYMDIPHLTYVHKQVDGCLTFAADSVMGSVFFQRVPFFRLPLTVVIYQSARNSITYYTSFFLFLVVIQTEWNAIGPMRTRVVTRYAVGWTNRLVGLFYPLIRWLLRRNYRILMSEDLPMRKRRGDLRTGGYDFRVAGEIPSFIESRRIMQQNVVAPEQNVIAPSDVPTWPSRRIAWEELVEGHPLLLGDPNHVGLSVQRRRDRVLVFPRLCPHEGACLDEAPRCRTSAGGRGDNDVIECPWHGRRFRPILSVELPARSVHMVTPWHEFLADGTALTISCRKVNGAALRDADWSRPAEPCPRDAGKDGTT